MEKLGDSKANSESAEDVDKRTVFVRCLPYSLTDSQLEDIFGEVGPVRHCFTVKEKGSDQHRGFGFVQFAVNEDAHRAVQEKNGAVLQGRKIKVEIAKRRAPLDVRLPKSDQSKLESITLDKEQLSKSKCSVSDSKKRKSDVLKNSTPVGEANEEKPKGTEKELKPGSGHQSAQVGEKHNHDEKAIKKNRKSGLNPQAELKAQERKEYDEAQGSSKQRPARTVVVGGLAGTEMAEAVFTEAKKVGKIEAIHNCFNELELNSHGLAKDGCKPRAAKIIYLSVKAARQAVAMLHQRTIAGGIVWARQLGGEGSKLKQLRLIARNLPFQITEATLRELFSPAGFVWEVTIPRKSDGLSKGFAFIGFTGKGDAEKGIELVNGRMVAKRPIAVDWAVAKKQYEEAVSPKNLAPSPDAELDDSESTADESDSDHVEEENNDSSDDSGTEKETGHDLEHTRKKPQKRIKADKTLKEKKCGPEVLILPDDQHQTECELKEPSLRSEAEKYSRLGKMGRTEEIDMVNKILTKVVTSTHGEVSSHDEEYIEALPSEKLAKMSLAKFQSGKALTSIDKKIGAIVGDGVIEEGNDVEESKLSRTVFIRNLPVDAKVPQLRKLFAEFGEIKSFRLVLHPVTKRPKGNAFLEYISQEAAQSAVSAAAKVVPEDVGLMLKGRAVSVSMAVDKDSARKLAKETFHKQVFEDKRNLALAKEGMIVTGTPAAEGVSKKDMLKRQQLEHEKATKLRSPNFHVSRIRLSVHNFPKNTTEKELKQLFVEAVKSRASKQNPVIKQVKILQDEDSKKSRGAAFVEFTEHQHALVALRVLNNNPATFGTENRPIVEFAIENSLVLRKRAANAANAKNWPRKGIQGTKIDEVGDRVAETQTRVGKTQRRGQEHATQRDGKENPLASVRSQADGERSHSKPSRKRKDRGEDKKEAKGNGLATGRTGGNEIPVAGLQNERQISERKIKRGKTSGSDRKAAQARRSSGRFVTSGQDEARTNPKEMKKPMDGLLVTVKSGKQTKGGVSKKPQPLISSIPTSNGDGQMVSKRQRSHKGGADTHDQLDKLVAEYRLKYFSGAAKPTNSKQNVAASGDLRRWFA